MRSRLGVASLFLVLALAAALASPLAGRLAPARSPADNALQDALALVASWLEARRQADDGAAAELMLPALRDRGTLRLSPARDPHIEAFFVYPGGGGSEPPLAVDAILHEVHTEEPYSSLYLERMTVNRVGARWLIVDWQPEDTPAVSAFGTGQPDEAATLVFEDAAGTRVTLPVERLPTRARPRATGGEVTFRAARFGPLALAPDGRFVAFGALGEGATLLAVWDVHGARVIPLDVYFEASVLDLHWSRAANLLAVTVRGKDVPDRVAVYRWPDGEPVSVPWAERLPATSVRALRWEALDDTLRIAVDAPPGEEATGASAAGEWRLRFPGLELERVAPPR